MYLASGFAALLAVLLSSTFVVRKPAVQIAGMRFFRDLGRIKARRRLHAGAHNSLSLYSNVLLGREEAIAKSAFEDNGVSVDMDELTDADGTADGEAEGGSKPLWLSLRGRVYDVSAGSKFYGPGKPYHSFTARDASRAFCTGCMEVDCLIPSLDGLEPAQVKEADRWLE